MRSHLLSQYTTIPSQLKLIQLSCSTVRSDLPGFEPALPSELPRDPKISTFNFFNSPATQIELPKGSIQNQISSNGIRTRNSQIELSCSWLAIHVELYRDLNPLSQVNCTWDLISSYCTAPYCILLLHHCKLNISSTVDHHQLSCSTVKSSSALPAELLSALQYLSDIELILYYHDHVTGQPRSFPKSSHLTPGNSKMTIT